jgi:dephospho-CoA kinase
VVEEFGPGLLTPDGDLDRPAMGRLVFGDGEDAGEARRRLEGIIHPLVYERITELEAEAPADAVVVHDIPLLTENSRSGEVDVPEEVQVERMVRDRGWTEDDARSRIRAQATREQRQAIATYLVDNTGTHEDLRHRVAEVLAELKG